MWTTSSKTWDDPLQNLGRMSISPRKCPFVTRIPGNRHRISWDPSQILLIASSDPPRWVLERPRNPRTHRGGIEVSKREQQGSNVLCKCAGSAEKCEKCTKVRKVYKSAEIGRMCQLCEKSAKSEGLFGDALALNIILIKQRGSYRASTGCLLGRLNVEC